MDDWADEKESLVSVSVSVSVSDEEKKMDPADSSTNISSTEEKIPERNGEREKENGSSGAGTGIMDSIASKLGVTVPGHSSKQEEEAKEEGGDAREENSRGIIHQLISNIPEPLLMLEDEVPAAEEASLLISIVED